MTDHERLRRELWIAIAAAVARAEVKMTIDSPSCWANHALREFDRAFPPEPEWPQRLATDHQPSATSQS